MTYTRETLIAERNERIEKEITWCDRKIQRLRKELFALKDPISDVFGNPEYRYVSGNPEYRKGDGSRANPLSPLAGTSLGEALKAAIALTNDNPLGPSQWIKFNDHTFYVNADEDLKDVALRVEYVRKTLFPTEAEYLAMR